MPGIIGNDSIKELLDIMGDKPPWPHTLLHGPPGTGKTTIARYIADHCNKSKFYEIFGPESDDFFLSFLITEIEEHDIIFIDEIHMLKKKSLINLYQPMEECIFNGNKLNNFTLIGATTDISKIPDALLRRFRIIKEIKLYTSQELSLIIKGLINIEDEASLRLSLMCKGIPGLARNYVEILGKISDELINNDDIKLLRNLYEVDELGLTVTDRKYLKLLNQFGIIGLKTIASLLQEPDSTIESKVEPFLMRIGFIVKTAKGRGLTPKGSQYIQG